MPSKEKDILAASGKPSKGGLEDTVPGWKAGRKHRASLGTRLVASLQLEAQEKSSWIATTLQFDQNVDYETLKATLNQRIMTVPRFRSKLVQHSFPKKLSFQELPESELKMDYLWEEAFPGKVVSDAEVNKYIGNLFDGWYRDESQPLWQMKFIGETEGGNSCLVIKMSHILGDGISLVELLYKLLDQEPESTSESTPAKRTVSKAKAPKLGLWTKTKVFVGGMLEGVTVVFSAPDKKNTIRLKDITKPSPQKRCSFSPVIEVARVKELQKLYQYATFNDILVTLLNLTLRAYFREVDDKAALKNKLRAQFPINMRSKKQGAFRNGNTSNYFSFGFINLNVKDSKSISELFWKTKLGLDKLKNSPAPLMSLKSGRVLEKILPRKQANDQLLNLSGKATMQLSNVPGPPGKVTIASATVEDMRFLLFTPLSSYVGLLTYNGKLTASFCMDGALADPELISKHWVPEFEKFFAHAKEEAAKQDGLIKPPRTGCF